jgi:hypothetical protein
MNRNLREVYAQYRELVSPKLEATFKTVLVTIFNEFQALTSIFEEVEVPVTIFKGSWKCQVPTYCEIEASVPFLRYRHFVEIKTSISSFL